MQKLFNLSGRSALVTGSTRGIGRAIAHTLAQAGANVAIHGTSSEQLADTVATEIRSYDVKCTTILKDLGDEDAPQCLFDATTDAFGNMDILVSNASIQIPKPWLKGSREDFHQQINANLRCAYELIQLVVPAMQKRQWGRILTVGSVQEAKPHPDMLVYAATKSAQTSMVRNLAKQLAPHGITVNNLAPGVIGTERSLSRLDDENYKQLVLSKIPTARIGKPEDCAGTALLLCSNAASYLTGQNIYVDGGMSL
ncbi:SDR family NAD(P)-dependent oxidoreductase [Rubellicoccus peritrichatus]|uniref:SDR family oxidoreductase n=1 Tax=Rubellicoccus peritrichatus TaxID=3080537 RepID=A0AAQ3LD61_9BACT|nr:SDR family oxidoreductase [Puniceicoccus sp. CR14]WOO43611.1 SDR family oxidoreductase [Puniceicoccus sp. CR14]